MRTYTYMHTRRRAQTLTVDRVVDDDDVACAHRTDYARVIEDGHMCNWGRHARVSQCNLYMRALCVESRRTHTHTHTTIRTNKHSPESIRRTYVVLQFLAPFQTLCWNLTFLLYKFTIRLQQLLLLLLLCAAAPCRSRCAMARDVC